MNIMLIGQMASGKSSVRNHLEGKGFTGISLAAPMKKLEPLLTKICSDSHLLQCLLMERYEVVAEKLSTRPLTEDQADAFQRVCECVRRMPMDDSPKQRKRLQYLGTEVRRKCAKDFWIYVMYHEIMLHPELQYVCDDVRFMNEYDFFSERGWLPIGLKVSREMQKQRLTSRDGTFDEAAFEHESEKEIEAILHRAYCINGDLRMDEMLKQADDVIKFYQNDK